MPFKSIKDIIVRQDFFVSGHSLCSGCGAAQIARILMKVAGKDSIIVNATGCVEISTTTYPWTAWKVPYIHVAFENAAAAASGIRSAYDALIMKKKLGKDVNVIVLAGDGGTADIGLQALSGAFEREDRITYICYDNEAYMNCLSTSSLILTKHGIKKVTEVKEGDEVYAFDQKTHQLVLKRCTGVFDNGEREVLEVETPHHNIRATPNHPFLVLKRNGRGKRNELVWKTLSELKVGDEVVVLKNLGEGKSFEFNLNPVQKGDYKVNRLNEINLPKRSSPALMKYLGIWVGDGWVRPDRGEVGFALPNGPKKKGRKILVKLHRTLFGSKLRMDKMYVYINSVNLARFIQLLGFGSGAKNKVIPSWVFTLPIEERKAFVEGLMLSDGYERSNSFRYVSSSYELLRRLRLLLQTMKYRVGKIHWQKRKRGENCVNRKLLKDTAFGYICFSKRKNPNLRKYPFQYRYRNFLAENEHFEMEKITRIKSIGKEPTLDLRVEDEHNFIANGIVVHNTGIQRSGTTSYGAWTTTSPAGQRTLKKDLMGIAIAHRVRYAATASIAYLLDVANKVEKAIMNAPSFIHWLQPCTTGWRYDPKLTVKLGRLAVKTGLWPLYEYYDGVTKLTVQVPKRVPVSEYLKPQGRFRHVMDNPDELAKIQSYADELATKFGLGPVG